MFEFASDHAWLIPALPLLACVLIGIFGKWLKGAAHWPAWLAMVASFVLSISLLAGISADPSKAIVDFPVFTWFSAGGFHVPVQITVDQLTAIYLSFITGIGLLIFIYAAGYMKGDYGYWRFFAYMSIFVFFMCSLVMGSNFILLYLGWEGVGLASYLLIGYYYPRPSAVAAAKKAFITNRIGDFGLAIGVFLIYCYFGHVDFTSVFRDAPATYAANEKVLRWLPFCLMLGAFGKSAQFPLHVWLPDAMEGPTPVSALIHAATMVTAGVYLIARTMPLFVLNPDALTVVACVGGFTAFLAATIALCQYDLKRIWAYSTLSQLGYMFLGLGVMASTSAVFHVFTHAFFKALLFLSAGSVMHAMGGELDIRKMSGVRKVMPITNMTMLIGCLALAGFPGLAGFFSKDEIIHAALNSPGPKMYLGILALVVALMTAYYTFRLYFKVFWGPLELPATAGHHEPSPFALADDHGAVEHGAAHDHAGVYDVHGHTAHGPNDGSPLMWVPLVILSLGAITAGYLGVFGGTGEGGWFHHFVGQTTSAGLHAEPAAAMPEEHEIVSATVMKITSGAIAIVGILIAYYFYVMNRAAAAAAAQRFKGLVSFLYHKWYWDEIYEALLLTPTWWLAHALSAFDKYVIDGLVWIVGFVPQLVGYSLRPTQRGLLQRYAVGMIAGLAAVVLGVLYLLR
jgi:NADH-quinone oxidoreductase subunit L